MPLNTVSPTIKVTVPSTAQIFTASSYDYEGVTATFAAPVDYQISADGSPVVISNRPISLISAAPSLSQVAPNGNTYVSQGAMLAPLAAISTQGFDQYFTATSQYDQTAYGNNVNPGATLQPVNWAIGAKGCYIQSLWRRFDETYCVQKYIPLVTVIDTPLLVGEFRPGVANGGAARTNYGANANNINLNVLRNSVTMPAGCRTLTTVISNLNQQDRLRPVWGAYSDDALRRMQTSAYGAYGQDFGGECAYNCAALHFTNTNALKMEWAKAIVQRAVDIRSVMDQGYLFGIGAGQNANGWVELVYAGFLLNDPTYLTAALQIKTNTTGQNYAPPWPDMVGRNMPWPGDIGSSNIQYTQPWYTEHDYMWLSGSHEDSSSKYSGGGYFMGNDAMTIMETLAIALLQNGPGGTSGEDWLTANGLRFLIDIMDDRHTMTPSNNGSIRYFTPLRDAYTALRPSLSAITNGRPTQTLPGRNTAITNGFRSDFTGYGYSRVAVTDRQSRLSLDRRWGPTWTGRSATTQDTTTGVLLGVPQWEQSRQVTAAGAGLWSTIYPNNQDKATSVNAPEPQITPIGSAGTTNPVNSHTPKILIRPYSAHSALRLEEFSGGTLPVNARQLYGSVGYWFGGGAPVSFNYKFQEDIATVWTDIAGTSGNIPLTTIGGASPAVGPSWGILDTWRARGKSVRFGVQGISSTGNTSAWVYSSAVTVPARTEKVDYLAPDAAFQLKDVTFRYNAAPAIVLSLHSARNWYPSYLMTANSTTAARAITIDQLPVLGDLSSVPEGEMLVQWARGLSNQATTRATLNFYMTGTDLASFNGYAMQYEATSLGWRHSLWQVVNGVYQSTALFPTNFAATALTASAYRLGGDTGPHMYSTNAPSTGVYTRLNWSLDGGLLRVKIKSWARWDYALTRYTEPVAWQDDWLIPTGPIASGRIGFGQRASGRDVQIMGLGVSIDPTVPAEIVPRVPAYTYA
jgi:hypothetical protein